MIYDLPDYLEDYLSERIIFNALLALPMTYQQRILQLQLTYTHNV